MTRPRVFVVQNQHRQDRDGVLQPKFDLEPARQHGELVFLLSPTARPFRDVEIVDELHRKLRDYGPADHLLLLGNPCLIGWATAIAAHHNGGRVQLLQWDGRNREYAVVGCDLRLSPR